MTAITESGKAVQYLTFKPADEVFALDITQVREVPDYTAVTKAPKMPESMRG